VTHLQKLTDRTLFWHSYTRITNELKKRCALESDKYPWSLEHVESGILERPYITYLISSGIIQSNTDITLLPDFSMTGMRNNKLPIDELNKLSQTFAKYRNGPNRMHAFLVGQLCHWISIICNKVGNHVEILVFDSRNHNLLTSPPEEFIRITNKNKKLMEWKREIYLYSLQEPVVTAQLFHDSIMGIQDITSIMLEHNMEGFLRSFETHVKIEEEKDDVIVPFVTWLENHWPPPVVEGNIIKVLEIVGVTKLSPNVRQQFINMVKGIKKKVDFQECGIPVVQRFEAAVLWLETAFSVFEGK